MNDVAIIGVGLHPFGRFEGKSAMETGAEIIHMAECGFCADGEQEKLLANGATEITGLMPINTPSRMASQSGRPVCANSTSWCDNSAARQAIVRRRVYRASGSLSSTARPAPLRRRS